MGTCVQRKMLKENDLETRDIDSDLTFFNCLSTMISGCMDKRGGRFQIAPQYKLIMYLRLYKTENHTCIDR